MRHAESLLPYDVECVGLTVNPNIICKQKTNQITLLPFTIFVLVPTVVNHGPLITFH